jgi:hypothetical protein
VSSFDWPITKKKGSNYGASPDYNILSEDGMPPLSPRPIGEKRMTLARIYGIQVSSYWEHVANLMGTHWELENNIEGTCSEQNER